MSEQTSFVMIAVILGTVIITLFALLSYNSKLGTQKEIDIIKTCVSSGGSWETQQLDKDYNPKYVCTRK